MTRGHERLTYLLPWYVAGTLPPEDAEILARHVRSCRACAREYEHLLRLRESLRSLWAAGPAPSEHVLTRTWLRILRHEHISARRRLLFRIAGPFAAVAAAAVIALAGSLSRPGGLITLGSTRPHDGVVLQVVFEPSAREAEIRSLLQEVGGIIVEGPRASGLYRVRLRSGEDPHLVLDRLRRERVVRFAEIEP